MELLEIVGSRVREARQARGWTIARLAETSGVSVRFLGDVEAGRGNVSLLKLKAVADALAIPLASLVAEEAGVIALVGLRGAGKSTIGRALAEAKGIPFFELDALIEREAGLSLAEIFAIHGETYYRNVEKAALERFLAEHARAVLATGGGIVTNDAAWQLLRTRTRVVWLKARPEDHWERVVAQGDRRPMADNPAAMAELRRLLRAREPLYKQAHQTIDTTSGLEAALAVLQ